MIRISQSTNLRWAVLVVAAGVRGVNAQSDERIPTWLAYVTAAGLVLLILYYCCKKVRFDDQFGAPLLGGQYNDDGQPISRQNIVDDNSETWTCEVCDFKNKDTTPTCVLCGTEQAFKLLQSPRPRSSSVTLSTPLQMESNSFTEHRQRSFAIRRINMLNSRQRGARNRHNWTRKVADDGKRYWSRKEDPIKEAKKKEVDLEKGDMGTPALASQHSVAFVSHLNRSDSNPEGRMTFTEADKVDASKASRGYDISEQDLEILEQVAALPFKEKYAWFLEQTTSLIKPWEDGHLKMRVHRDNVLVESMEQLLGVQMEHIHMPLRIEFIGEPAIDAGGLEREWYALLSEKLFDETIGLFMCAHIESNAYVINCNSAEASVDHLLYYRGAGRLIGRALLEGMLMKAHLALPMLKHLLGVPISFSDLEFIDIDVYKSLKWMKENEGVEALCLDFSVTNRKLNGTVETIDLKPDGREIAVTDENKFEYIQLRMRYIMLDRYADQLQHLMAGIFEVIPQELILVFDYQELELVLSGVPHIDVGDWRLFTDVSDNMTQELQDWFWDIINEYTDEEKCKLLQFTTGSSRVPVQGFKALTSYDGRICHFTLKGVPYPENEFPRSHTCFNRIDIPLYTKREELEEALSLVINMEVTGFTDE